MNQNSVASMTLKVVGVILVLSSLLDYLLLAFPFNPLERQWQLTYTAQLVERGIIPLVGIAFLLAGFWMQSSEGANPSRRNALQDLRFWAFLLSTVLGLVFLLLFPLHLNNVRLQRSDTLQEIRDQAVQTETQVVNRLGNENVETEIERRRSALGGQLRELLSDEQRLEEALANPEVPEQEKELLQQLRENPDQIDQFLQERFSVESLSEQQVSQIRERRENLEAEAKTRLTKLALQTGISSLLLAVGYSIIGWTGLRSMGTSRSGRRSPSPR
jgi:hypothetical protein